MMGSVAVACAGTCIVVALYIYMYISRRTIVSHEAKKQAVHDE